MNEIYTVGHSGRLLEEFLSLLKEYGISLLVDVRRFPTSRKFPWYQREYLEGRLNEADIQYMWLGELLGGYRTGGYLKYMGSSEYSEGIDSLIKAAKKTSRTAIMCSEKLWFRCHRRYISDTLVERGFNVIHIIDMDRIYIHRR